MAIRTIIMTVKTKTEKIKNSKSVSGKLGDWATNARERSKRTMLMPIEMINFCGRLNEEKFLIILSFF